MNAFVTGAKYVIRETFEDAQYWRRRRKYRSLSSPIPPCDRAIVEELRRSGGCVSSLDALGLPETPDMLDAADQLFAAIADRAAVKGGFIAIANQDEIERHPALIRWGLDDRLLAIVENYLCTPVDYRGLSVRRDVAGGEQLETRLWHRDYEDWRILKIIVYLNDVDAGGGAYEFIPRSQLPIQRVGPLGGRVDDAAMSRFVPPESWRSCSGPRGTVVFSDTCKVYHRGTVAHSEDRRALFFSYNSRSPRSPQYCMPLFDRARFAATAGNLSARQREAIGQ